MEVYNTEQGSIREWECISLSRGVLANGDIAEQGDIREWEYISLTRGVIENGGIYNSPGEY